MLRDLFNLGFTILYSHTLLPEYEQATDHTKHQNSDNIVHHRHRYVVVNVDVIDCKIVC